MACLTAGGRFGEQKQHRSGANDGSWGPTGPQVGPPGFVHQANLPTASTRFPHASHRCHGPFCQRSAHVSFVRLFRGDTPTNRTRVQGQETPRAREHRVAYGSRCQKRATAPNSTNSTNKSHYRAIRGTVCLRTCHSRHKVSTGIMATKATGSLSMTRCDGDPPHHLPTPAVL